MRVPDGSLRGLRGLMHGDLGAASGDVATFALLLGLVPGDLGALLRSWELFDLFLGLVPGERGALLLSSVPLRSRSTEVILPGIVARSGVAMKLACDVEKLLCDAMLLWVGE